MSNLPDPTTVPLGHGEWLRQLADEIDIPLVNRYFELNPANAGARFPTQGSKYGDDQHSALISRAGVKRWLSVGDGPIQEVYSKPGTFSEALFVVSGQDLYRVDTNEAVTSIGNGVSIDERSRVSMTATNSLGSTPEYLFIAGGSSLFVYIQNGYAFGTLTGSPANNDVVTIDTTYYKFTTGSVDAGTPAGTLANPWLVLLGATPQVSMGNLYAAINISGTAGTQYSTATTVHTTAQGIAWSTNTLVVRALTAGIIGNAIATTETGGAIAWGGSTLANGGSPYFSQVQTPDGVGVIGLFYLAGFVGVLIVGGEGENGRFYWIEPGDIIIKPLNFATAERSPDPLISARVVGDQVLLFGTDSTEVWYVNPNATDPSQAFLRTQGVVFDRGIWDGTDAQIRDRVFVVDENGVVYTIYDGQPQRISNNAIEEMIREAMRNQINQENAV